MSGLKQQLDRIRPQFEKGGKLARLHSVFDGFYTFLYTPNTTARSGVQIHDSNDSKRTMIIVVLALLPCCLFGMWNIGYQHGLATGVGGNWWECWWYGFMMTLPMIFVTYLTGLGIEFIFAQIRGHEIQEGFLVSGLLIPMICPVDTPCWMLAVATAFSVIFCKEVFGGTGYNFMNPALVARAFLFFAYPAKMSGDKVFVSLGGQPAVDGFTGATPLGQLASSTGNLTDLTNAIGEKLTLSDAFWGFIPGSWGETSTFCILIGAAILLFTGIASWRTMVSVFAGGLAMGYLFQALGVTEYPAWWHLIVGGFAFGAVFMATDPVTSSQTNTGKYIVGLMTGALAVLIRVVNPAYPEGMMLSILFMNALAPLVDYYVVEANVARRKKRVKLAK